MKARPVVPRARANQDVEEAIDHYLREHAAHAALGLVAELERAYAHLGRNPGTGSMRYAHQLNLPGLRAWPLTRFPFLIFYMEMPDRIDVWRVLHDKRDVPQWMQEPDIVD